MITEEGLPTQEKEEKNTISEQLMYRAVAEIASYKADNKDKFEEEIRRIQSYNKKMRDTEQLTGKETYLTDQLKIQCKHCGEFLCLSTDMRKIQSAHHVCIAESIWQNVNVENEEDTNFKYDGKMLKFYGSIYCKQNCGKKVGKICDFRGKHYPLIKIKKVRLENTLGEGMIFNKWSQVPFKVKDINVHVP